MNKYLLTHVGVYKAVCPLSWSHSRCVCRRWGPVPLCSLSGFGSALASMLLKQVSDRVGYQTGRRPLFLFCMDSSMPSRHWRNVYILFVSSKVWGPSGVEPDGSVSEGGRGGRGHIRVAPMAGQWSSPLLQTRFLAVVLLCRLRLWFSLFAQPWWHHYWE